MIFFALVDLTGNSLNNLIHFSSKARFMRYVVGGEICGCKQVNVFVRPRLPVNSVFQHSERFLRIWRIYAMRWILSISSTRKTACRCYALVPCIWFRMSMAWLRCEHQLYQWLCPWNRISVWLRNYFEACEGMIKINQVSAADDPESRLNTRRYHLIQKSLCFCLSENTKLCCLNEKKGK